VVGEFEISAEYHPATEVGGDFYNVFPLYDHGSPATARGSDGPVGSIAAGPESCAAPVSTHRDPRVATRERAAIVIGDVAGKGVQAAMFMTVATTLLEELARQGLSPAEALVRANERLYPKLRPHRMFVTLLYGVLDPATGQFTFSSAGQTGPILCPRDGPPRFLQQSSLPLAAMPSVQYEERACVLEPGDALVFVSDGLIEAHATGGAPLGYAGLLEVVARTRDERPERWLERLWEAVASRQATDRDDATTIVVQRRSGSPRPLQPGSARQ
jgi:serine phosphatase RsbU (regulator of sigma subunit)